MTLARISLLTILALVAFAGNSLLCRAALAHTQIDAASFTTIRLLSGAVVLAALAWFRHTRQNGNGNWTSAFALFAYAAAFSFSYIHLTAATGALLMFGAVQITMIGFGIRAGERFRSLQIVGLVVASVGLIGLLLPGLTAPPLMGALLMIGAGISWGIYSLRGKGAGDPLTVTAGNFIRATPIAICLSLLLLNGSSFDVDGVTYAILSGALASGVGYAIWYTALPFLKSTTAATVQLSVPVITAFGGVVFLGESLTLRLFFASVAIVGGIALVILTGEYKNKTKVPSSNR